MASIQPATVQKYITVKEDGVWIVLFVGYYDADPPVIFVDVLDEHGGRIVGQPVTLYWADGQSVGVTEEKQGDPGAVNFPINATFGSYGVRVDGSDVFGMGLGKPEDPNVKHHCHWLVVFQKASGPVVPRYKLTFGVYGDGEIIGQEGEYEEGTVVEISAHPAERFIEWQGSASGKANPYFMTMDGHKHVIAKFQESEVEELLDELRDHLAKADAIAVQLQSMLT